ncbi:NUDIX hydrolase [Streptomyces mayonensis]|uniref:NUDIX hydrolase n=1 Tax=Streptomyces mayonensis TaxID=2750816 RepID=UPI001C1E6F82|nr:NUDIX hydrolase [Streptomyces sp. A108]MBU6531721.1 NUDIX hydrolase [Streptomyces sp. A108]
MSTSPLPSSPSGPTGPQLSGIRRFVRPLLDALALLPRGALAFGAVAVGRENTGRTLLRAGAGPAEERRAPPRPDRVRVMAHAALAVLLGALSLVLAAVILLALARGALYGLVDRGPYDASWGGPSRAGAWLAHFAAAVPAGCAALGALHGITALHHRVTAPLRGERRVRWALPTALGCALAGTLFVVAFVRQLP